MVKEKPMLAIDSTDYLNQIKYPKLRSNKLDGIRFWAHPILGLVSRALKPIKSIHLQKKFKHVVNRAKKLNIIIDGEFYVHGMSFQAVSRVVMTEDFNSKTAIKRIMKSENIITREEYNIYTGDLLNRIELNIFEVVMLDGTLPKFSDRYSYMLKHLEDLEYTSIVSQTQVNSEEEVLSAFKTVLEEGYEGLILRDPDSPYKFGRSSLKEEYMLKVKPFKSFDAKIIGVTQRYLKTNEAEINELGRSFRRQSKDDKEPTGLAACFEVLYEGVPLKVTITGTEEFRKEIWDNRLNYLNKYIEYRGMLIGSKDVPRHPTLLRLRKDRDD